MSGQKPSVGGIVHYVSFGTPGGEYQSRCRTAVISEVGQWVTVETREQPGDFFEGVTGGRPMRTLVQHWHPDAVALAVFTPTGLFFNGAGQVACKHDEVGHVGGTWHWPERIE